MLTESAVLKLLLLQQQKERRSLQVIGERLIFNKDWEKPSFTLLSKG
jgi:hypothetical protein